MNQDEKWAESYLKHVGFPDPKYEPDGNTPPDFLLDNYIAVEVRRLNQLRYSGSNFEPLDQLATPLIKTLERLFESLGKHPNGVSWYVFPNFKRPQQTAFRDWTRILVERLSRLMLSTGNEQEHHISVDQNFNLQLIRCHGSNTQAFILGGYGDLDTGGWVMEKLTRSISICIEEKAKKISTYRNKYPKWWLLLIDHVYVGEPRSITLPHNWDRVIIIHPRNFDLAYEVLNPLQFDAPTSPPLP